MNVTCLECGKPMRLLREAVSNYAWQCPDQCLPAVDTGVAVTEEIAELRSSYLAACHIYWSSRRRCRQTGSLVQECTRRTY